MIQHFFYIKTIFCLLVQK